MMGEKPKQWHLFWGNYPGRVIIKKFENSQELNLRLFGLAPSPTDNHEIREDPAIK